MSWVFDLGEYDADSDSAENMATPSRCNPPAITETVEEEADAPVKKFGSFRVANQRIKKVSLRTPLKPDHSYNAVSFNVSVKKNSKSWVYVTGFEASGHLRVISIYKLFGKDVNHYTHKKNQWDLIHRKKYPKSWKTVTVLKLGDPVKIGPGETCGFYIHSNCDNDRGLKYRSCRPGVVLEDSCIRVHHGWAHTSSIPFDLTRGWIRNHRVLSGSIFYEPIPLRWSPDRNGIWQDKSPTYQLALDAVMSSSYFSTGILVELMTFCGIDWFNRDIELVNEDDDVKSISNIELEEIKEQVASEPRRGSINMRSMMEQLSETINGIFRIQRTRSAPVLVLQRQVDAREENPEEPIQLEETQSDFDEFDSSETDILLFDKKRTI